MGVRVSRSSPVHKARGNLKVYRCGALSSFHDVLGLEAWITDTPRLFDLQPRAKASQRNTQHCHICAVRNTTNNHHRLRTPVTRLHLGASVRVDFSVQC